MVCLSIRDFTSQRDLSAEPSDTTGCFGSKTKDTWVRSQIIDLYYAETHKSNWKTIFHGKRIYNTCGHLHHPMHTVDSIINGL